MTRFVVELAFSAYPRAWRQADPRSLSNGVPISSNGKTHSSQTQTAYSSEASLRWCRPTRH
jgi:hypothetical protein